MAPLDDTTAATRFDSFSVYRTPYKTIDDHNIEVGILIPKDLKPGKHPLLVKFHGGGLVNGDALFADWISAFFVPFIHRNNAITVLPNYRLTPEATGQDILDDLADFWSWFNGGGVTKFLTSQNISAELDYEHLLVSGDSAGGYVALQSGLTRPKGEIRAILAQYPMTNHARRTPTTLVMGYTPPPESTIDEHFAAVQNGTKPKILSSAPPEDYRNGLSVTLNAYNRYTAYFGVGKNLWPITAVEDAKHLPPTWIVHGDADTAVVFSDSTSFVEKVGKLLPDTEIHLVARSGQEHGFDIDSKEDEEPWLKEMLKGIEEKWLA